jgi:ribosomal protein S18 acetylase RimI-like enzyme
MGAESLELQVNVNNKAKGFYERLGFVEREKIDLDIGNGYFMNDYVMEKKL